MHFDTEVVQRRDEAVGWIAETTVMRYDNDEIMRITRRNYQTCR
jgi:hypothetical protein